MALKQTPGQDTSSVCLKKQKSFIPFNSEQRKKTSVYQAEQLTILDSIIWTRNLSYKTFIIFSDSLLTITVLEDISTKNIIVSQIIQYLQKIQKQIYIQWIRSHSGNTGNELADMLTKEETDPKTKIARSLYLIHLLT